MCTLSHPTTPEGYRQRYLELKRVAEEKERLRPPASRRANPDPLPADCILHEEVIPGGWYWSVRLARGQSLRLVNDEATPGLSFFAWDADDSSERINAADTLKLQWNATVTKGRLLFSDMGRVLASITDDTADGGHDALAGGSTAATNLERYGAGSGARDTRSNFILAAGKHGLSRRDIAPCLTFFAPVRVDADGNLIWRDELRKPGAYVDLRAEMNLLIALSNCPHPLAPQRTFDPRPVRAIVWNSPAPAVDDFCRNATDEAIRGFENTDRLFEI